MEKQKKDRSMFRQALGLGIISIFAYLTSYYTRSLLSVATPNILAEGAHTAEFVAFLSSSYFLSYAAGQLINGFVGDRVNPKYMVSVGLFVTGCVTLAFPLVPYAWIQIACFILMGLGLSMLRGPIMKMVAENLNKDYSRTICTLLSSASFAGVLVASGFAIVFDWDWMFIVSGALTIAVAIIAFVVLSIFEHKGMLKFTKGERNVINGFFGLFKLEHFVFYMIVGGIVEVAASAIGFWIPTYLSDALEMGEVATQVINAGFSVVSSLAPFLALFIFKLIKEKDIVMLRVGFLLAVIFFALMLIPGIGAVGKIVFFMLAKLCLACCSSVLWSIYIPGMGSTGKVSSINGVINCTGYASAAIANAIFGKLYGMNWNQIIMIWGAIAVVGLVASLIVRQRKKKKEIEG